MTIRNLFVVTVCTVLLACNDTPSGPGEIQILSLGLNSTSRYSWSVIMEDTLGQESVAATDTLVTRVASTDDAVGNYVGLTRMEAYSIPHYVATTQVWYKSYPDSLVEIAYYSPGATPTVLPKRTQVSSFRPGNIRTNADYVRTPLAVRYLMKARGVQDSVIERTDKRIVYVYPLTVGVSWISFTDPFRQTREVVGYESVTAGNRNFWCAKIRTSLPDLDPNIEWFDYVTWEGLIKRTIRIRTIVSTAESPDGPGTTMWFNESLTKMD